MQIPNTLLGGLTPEEFLRDYWQKKPLLIRQGLPDFGAHFDPEELAGLALEEEVESRLVLERDGERPWQVLHGPQEEETFLTLPESHWTLLVQEVNRHVPAVARMLDYFAFIPSWRLDDIMVSFAVDQGSVGPHIDHYDVFLIQAEGERHWQISSQQVTADDLIPNIDLRIMRDFRMEQEWTLQPGDILYLPPGLPHYGVAQGPCMTYSVGFRAPTTKQLWQHYLDHVLAQADDAFYSDPGLKVAAHSGELTATTRERIRAIIRSLPMDDASLDDWFGHYSSEPSRGDGPLPPDQPWTGEEFREALEALGGCTRSEATRYAWFGEPPHLYINGESIDTAGIDPQLVRLIADRRHYTQAELAPYLSGAHLNWLVTLSNRGYLEFEDEDDGED